MFLSTYANGNLLYTFGDNLKKIKNNLRNSFDIVSYWFYENYMVLNAEKCYFMCLRKNEKFLFNNSPMENSNEQKIPLLIRDNKLNFKNHINEFCKKLLRKLELYVDCQAIYK